MVRCPYCGYENEEGSKYCMDCGKPLASGTRTRQENAQLAANTGLLLGQAARRARLEAVYEADQLIGARAYNGVMLGVLLWGLIINVLLCFTVGDVYRYVDPIVFFIGYLVCAIAGTVIAGKSHKPLVSFLGYNLVVIPFGLTISTMVAAYGGIGSRVVADAFLYTLLITAGMGGAALAFPELFDRLGGALFGTLIGLVVCELLLLVFRVNQSVTDWIAAGLFSLYIGYDLHRSQQFAKTLDNAVDCALDIYLDIANLFLRLLRLLSRKKD